MQQLALYAIAIDDVRDIFGADPALAERLRGIAAAKFAPPAPPKKRWFKPLMRFDIDSIVDPSLPSSSDVDALLAGGFIPVDRTPQCWSILGIWLEELAAAQHSMPYDDAAFERVEWDLAKAGLNSDYALRKLAERELGTPLRPQPGQLAGYAKHVHVVETFEELGRVRNHPGISAETAAIVDPVLRVLSAVPNDDRLDLVAVTAEPREA